MKTFAELQVLVDQGKLADHILERARDYGVPYMVDALREASRQAYMQLDKWRDARLNAREATWPRAEFDCVWTHAWCSRQARLLMGIEE